MYKVEEENRTWKRMYFKIPPDISEDVFQDL